MVNWKVALWSGVAGFALSFLVGVIGGQYYFLGPGNVWILCDPVRLARWHDWEAVHADWRAHVIINKQYRRDARGHVYPWHNDRSQDKDHGHGH